MDDDAPRPKNTPLEQVLTEDLDPLSIDELEARIVALEAEVTRCRKKIEQSTQHKSAAEALFKK